VKKPPLSSLEEDFRELSFLARRIIGLLEETDERYWILMFSRSLEQIETNNLSGATSVLGCFGGEDTFSDLILAKHLEESEPLQFKNLNARLERLRNETFQAARKIASRKNW
tara:strand:+ start:897 stop:1232 length:336 start_codon:yes stop_codon:yes gene_type:complete